MLINNNVNTKIILDLQQEKLQKKLKKLAHALENQGFTMFFNIFNKKQDNLKGLYIHGFAGCGKTTLMQEFYHSITKVDKIYFHFNSFMRLIHEALRDIRLENKKYPDELIEAVNRVVKDKKLLCFDEFQVLDIADAMLLGRIFSYLFAKKTIVIFTSNSAPLELYKNGLQRQVFLEFVNNILLQNCEVFELNSGIDYRQIYRQNLNKRYFVSNKKNRAKIKEIIANFINEKPLKSRVLKVWGRDVKIKKTYEKIAVINFDDICRVELAAADYQAMAQEFDLIFLLKLPVFTSQDINEMRRFTLFIDEIYENKTALIILAKKKIDYLYSNQNIANQHARTISRLKEIKTDYYWQASKIAAL